MEKLVLVIFLVIGSTKSYSNDFADLSSDPFFSSLYQVSYDPAYKGASVSDKIEQMPSVDSDPDFTYKYEHISPYEVDLPEAERKARERRGSPDFFDNYDKYYGVRFEEPEKVVANLWHGKKDKKDKKEKKDKKKKEKKPADPQGDPSSYSFNIDFDPSDEYERIKDISDQQRETLARDPGACKVIIMDGQICQECLDVNSGDTSQTCNYADEMKPARYAYEKEASFDSKTMKPNDADFDDEPSSYTGNDASFEANSAEHNDYDTESFEAKDAGGNDGGQNEELVPYKHSIFFSEPTHEEIKDDSTGYFPHSIDQDFFPTNTQAPVPIKAGTTQKPQKPHPIKDATSYYRSKSSQLSQKLRKPKQTHESLVAAPVQPIFQYADTRKDVDRALNEFKKRDWSACKKTTKGDQTCYICKDPHGVNHNECMTVSESRPQSVKVSFNNTRNAAYGRATTASPIPDIVDESKLEVIEKPLKKRTKKVVIVKRKKADDLNPNDNADDRVVEKRTYKRMVTYSGPVKPVIEFDFEKNKTAALSS